MKKIAIYSPYLDTAGGGEKYMLAIAEVLSQNNKVDVLIDSHLQKLGIEQIKKRIEKFHDLDLSKIKFIISPIGPGGSFFKRFLFLKNYDLFFLNTDGSIFFSTAKKNILHFQIPIENKVSNSLWGKFKLSSWQSAIYNSHFTKDFIEASWPIKGQVIYPPILLEIFKPNLKKKLQIISVGRFASHTRVKKHEVMIDMFRQMKKQNKIPNWSLHLAGGAGEGDEDYVKDLKERGKDFDIFIHSNLSLEKLIELYSESAIYWHAMGYGETDPIKFEHFGITTVEGMASGCVPVVINKGGQKETVVDGESGYLWDSPEECIQKTLKLINNPNLRDKMSKSAIIRSKKFNFENFSNQIKAILEND